MLAHEEDCYSGRQAAQGGRCEGEGLRVWQGPDSGEGVVGGAGRDVVPGARVGKFCLKERELGELFL